MPLSKLKKLFYWLLSLLFRLCFAVEAAINPVFAVGQLEDVRKLLLRRRDTARIFAEDDVCKALWKFGALFFNELAVLNYVDGAAGIDVY